jgi:triosephosphate isomerase (TIM)
MDKLLIVNLKAHEHGIGRRARYIGDIVNRLSNDSGVRIVLAAQPTDIESLSYKNEVFAQHIDPIPYGSSTGYILPEAVKGAGATGTLINHSERSLSIDDIRQRIERAKNVGLSTVVFASSAEHAGEIAGMGPGYIAFGTPMGIPLSNSRNLLEETISRVRAANPAVRILACAGVKSGQDVITALSLGASGALVSSTVLKSNNPEDALRDILGGF